MAALGVGPDFGKYCGQLDRCLTDAVNAIRAVGGCGSTISELKAFIESLVQDGELANKQLARARVAVLIDLAGRRSMVTAAIGEALASDIEGRLAQIINLLSAKNVFLLPGGSLEHYLPSYSGPRYALNDELKRRAVEEEVVSLASGYFDGHLAERYGALFDAVCKLPAKPPVDMDAVLMAHLGDYIYQLQSLVLTHRKWTKEQINRHFASATDGLSQLFNVSEFSRTGDSEFAATIQVLRVHRAVVRITHETNAGMRCFKLEPEPTSSDSQVIA